MAPDRFVSYAQNLEDVMLWRALGGAVDGAGFYIDVGAADPTALSVTRAFYDRGWRGLNVEPLPEMAGKLRQARPRDVTVQAAVAASPGRLVFHRVVKDEQTGLSTLHAAEAALHGAAGAVVDTLEVEVVTLASLCREHVAGPVHILKVDAEGAEAEVLAGADFAAVRPWIVVVEATRPTSEDRSEAAWEPALLAAGYRAVWFDGLNRFYLADEHAELARHFTLPPNVFDSYVPYDPVLEEHVLRTGALADERGAAITRLEEEVARLSAALEDARASSAAAPPVPEPPVTPPPVPEPVPVSLPLPMPRGRVQRLGGKVYRRLRPVLRPLAHRARAFLTDELGLHMIDMRAKQDLTLARLELLEVKVGSGGGQRTLSPSDANVLERALLTLALDGDGPARKG